MIVPNFLALFYDMLLFYTEMATPIVKGGYMH